MINPIHFEINDTPEIKQMKVADKLDELIRFLNAMMTPPEPVEEVAEPVEKSECQHEDSFSINRNTPRGSLYKCRICKTIFYK